MTPEYRSTQEFRSWADADVQEPDRLRGLGIAEGQPILPKASDRMEALKAKQILVVDDDPDIREMLATTVARAGFRADTASDGESGWYALCHVAYDLVITDNEMPRLTGLKLIERLRSFSTEPPCILISGNLRGAETISVRLIGRGAVLEKPFTPAALIEKIYGALLYGNGDEP